MSSKRERAVIKVENLSKAYQIGQFGTGTISRDLERWWVTRVKKQDDPFLKIGETNDRTKKGSSDIVWSLRDLNFEINQGDAVGIIGKNGAGKSTLLKILSRVTAPTSGSFKVRGRIASLLEVGTGFHPELTGRENIYLNGAILGMRKKEITRKLDEIIDFSGVERYIDTPVKRYSSGMYVRLAFAVAAHLESEILVVDEVLAVGDSEFQKKCLGKMGEVSKGEGRTVLFVSHNMASIKALCNSGILLENGRMKLDSDTETVVKKYLGGDSDNLNYKLIKHEKDGFKLIDFTVTNANEPIVNPIARDKEVHFIFNYDNYKDLENLYFNIKIKDEEGKYLITTISDFKDNIIREGEGRATMIIPDGFFNEGQFFIDLMIIQKNQDGYKVFFHEQDILCIQILPEKRELGTWMGKELGSIRHTFDWQ